MQTLCAISDWETTTAERGKFAGNVITSRQVIALDSWNFIHGTEKKDGNVSGQQFYGSVRLLAIWFDRKGVDLATIVPIIARALTERTGTKLDLPAVFCSPKEWIEFAALVDKTFDCSYADPKREYPPKVYRRLFPFAKDE